MAKKRFTRKKVNNPVIDTALNDIYDKLEGFQPSDESTSFTQTPTIGQTQVVTSSSGITSLAVYTKNGWFVDINSNFQPTSSSKGFSSALGVNGKSQTPVHGEAVQYNRNKSIAISNNKKEKVLLKNVDGILNVRNADDSDDVEIKARRFRFKDTESSASPTISPTKGDFYYASNDNLHRASTGGIFCDGSSNLASGQTSQLLLSSNHANSMVKFYEGAIPKFVLGYDKHGATTFTDATCNTTLGDRTITFDHGGTLDDSGAVGMLVAGDGIPAGSVITSFDASGNTMEISEEATATATDVTLTFTENDNRFKIDSGANLDDPSIFSLDSTGALELFGTGNNLKLSYDASNYATFATNSSADLTITTVGSGTTDSDIRLAADGKIVLDPANEVVGVDGNVKIAATKGLYFDYPAISNDTYIVENSDDSLRIIVGGDTMLTLAEEGSEGNRIVAQAPVGFMRQEATFSDVSVTSSSGTDDTDIDFRITNKFRLEMTGDITNMSLIFPNVSGNFLLVCTTNGDHDVGAWRVHDHGAVYKGMALWPGGTAPAFTNNGIDIVSFYWDNNEEQAYGNVSLAFAAP